MSQRISPTVVGLMGLLTACEDLPFHAVSIKPTYGWVDGCTDVRISGHGFENSVSATIGGKPVEEITLPDAKAKPLDVGYTFTARTPEGSPGLATVKVSSGNEAEEIEQGFYYIACPASPFAESLSTDAAAVGDAIELSGCNLDTSAQRVELRSETGVPLAPVVTAPLEASCKTARARFTVPSVPDGTYHLYLVDEGGNDIWPVASCDTITPDTADTGSSCENPLTLVIGGGR